MNKRLASVLVTLSLACAICLPTGAFADEAANEAAGAGAPNETQAVEVEAPSANEPAPAGDSAGEDGAPLGPAVGAEEESVPTNTEALPTGDPEPVQSSSQQSDGASAAKQALAEPDPAEGAGAEAGAKPGSAAAADEDTAGAEAAAEVQQDGPPADSESGSPEAVRASAQKSEVASAKPKAQVVLASVKQDSRAKTSSNATPPAFSNGSEYLLSPVHAGAQAMNANAQKLTLEKLDRSYKQLWKCVYTGDGFAYLLTTKGRALGVEGGKARSGAAVALFDKSNSKAQMWRIVADGDRYKIVSALSTASLELVLGVRNAASANGSLLEVAKDKRAAHQRWGATDITTVRKTLDKQAQAAKMPEGSYAIASALERMLALTATGSDATNYTYTGAVGQGWTIRVGSDGWASILANNGMALDARNASSVDGTQVWLYKANSSRAQKWLIEKNGNGTYVLRSALWPNMVLDVPAASTKSGTKVQLHSANGTKAQTWDLRQLAPSVSASAKLAAGWYGIKPVQTSALALDVHKAAWSAGTAIQLFTSNGTMAQRFRLVAAGSYYRIESGTNAGSYVALDGGKVVAGAAVVLTGSANPNTLFSLVKTKNGYQIVNVASGLSLGLNGSVSKGARLVGRDAALGGVCEFKIASVPGLLDKGAYAVRTIISGNRALSVAKASWSAGAGMELSSYKKQLDRNGGLRP